jgi:hypothetical protein
VLRSAYGRPSPTRTRWPHNFHFSLFKRSGRYVRAPARCRSAAVQEMRMPFCGMDCQEGSGVGDRQRIHFFSVSS